MTLHKFSKLFFFSLLAATLSSAQVCRVEQGCTGANTAVGARANLGLVIGTNVQAYSSALDSWAGKAVPSGTVVGTTDTQTLSSKTISAPIVTSPQINQIQDFNNNLSILLNPTANAVNGFVVTNAAAGGDVAIGAYGSSSNIGIQLVPKGTGKLDLGAVTALKISGTAGVVSIDGSGNVTTISPSGSGTVTSVGLSAPAIFSVSGSPVTTTGTLALSLATQTANTIWSGPTSGGAATPTFRSLVAADIPTLDAAKIGTGQLAAARVLSTVTNSRCVRVDGSGNLTVAAIDCTTNAGDTIAPATNTADYIPQWNGANSKTLKDGLEVYSSAISMAPADILSHPSSVVQRTNGSIVGYTFWGYGISVGNGIDAGNNGATIGPNVAGIFRGDFVGTDIARFLNSSGTKLSYIAGTTGNFVGNVTGNASTTTALAASPPTCDTGQVVHGGITANGSPVGCNPINLASEVSGTLPVGNGGTGLSTYTSGGILYASASNTLASSGALTANAPVIGGGAGGAPTVGSRSGNTTTFATTSGVLTSGHCTQIDASGNIVDSGAACGGGGGSGTVTSVGLSLPTELTVSGSPVTTSGTLSATWANQSQRAFFAAPTSGSGTPSFRFLEAADIGSGTVSVARGGTGASSFSGSKCVESNAGGTALQSSAGPCLSGSGFVNYAAEFSGSTTNLGSRAYASTTAKSTSSVVKTGSNGETFVYDYGAQTYNVHAYGAVGNGIADDGTAIAAAISACQNGTGGTVLLPNNAYATSQLFTLGNGDGSSTNNTLKACRLVGTGAGEVDGSSVVRAGTYIKYIGSSPGTPSFMIKIAGPYIGGEVNGILLDANSVANVSGLQLQQVQYGRVQNVGVIHHRDGPAVSFKPVLSLASASNNGCRNIIDGVYINAYGSNGEGFLFEEGTGSGGNYADSCSISIRNVVAYGTTYGMKVIAADNLHVERAELHGQFTYTTGTVSITSGNSTITGSGTTWTSAMDKMNVRINGKEYKFNYVSSNSGTITPNALETFSGAYTIHTCSLFFQRSTVHSSFPHENYFEALSSTDGVCGETGTAHPNMFVGYNYGDCSNNCDVMAGIASGTKPVVQTPGYIGSVDAHIRGYNYYGAEISANNSVDQIYLRGDQGSYTNLWKAYRPALSNAFKLYVNGGTFQLDAQGIQVTPTTFSGLPSCNSSYAGTIATITDGPSSPTYLQTVSSGGGSTKMPVYCNGTNWIAH